MTVALITLLLPVVLQLIIISHQVFADCPSGIRLRNAVILPGSNTPGSTRRITCNAGYVIEGASVIICQENGQWTRDARCVQVPVTVRRTTTMPLVTADSEDYSDVPEMQTTTQPTRRTRIAPIVTTTKATTRQRPLDAEIRCRVPTVVNGFFTLNDENSTVVRNNSRVLADELIILSCNYGYLYNTSQSGSSILLECKRTGMWSPAPAACSPDPDLVVVYQNVTTLTGLQETTTGAFQNPAIIGAIVGASVLVVIVVILFSLYCTGGFESSAGATYCCGQKTSG